MSWFNPKTQGVIDNTLNTLQIWFGSGANSNTGGTTPPATQATPPVSHTPSGGSTPPPNNNKKIMTYVGIGAGIIVVGLTAFVIIKKSKK